MGIIQICNTMWVCFFFRKWSDYISNGPTGYLRLKHGLLFYGQIFLKIIVNAFAVIITMH